MLRRSSFRTSLVGAIALVSVACTSTEPVEASADGLPPTDIGITPHDALVPWKSTSRRVEISSYSQDESFGYAKDRAELTSEQLAALAKLRFHFPKHAPYVDVTHFDIRITDEDGTVALYRADSSDGLDLAANRSRPAASAVIRLDTLEPFLQTIRHCVRRTTYRARTSSAPAAPDTLSISRAQALSTDSGCSNRFYIEPKCGEALLTFDVPALTTYELVVPQCFGEMSLRAYAERQSGIDSVPTLVATGAPRGSSCLTLRHIRARAIRARGRQDESGRRLPGGRQSGAPRRAEAGVGDAGAARSGGTVRHANERC